MARPEVGIANDLIRQFLSANGWGPSKVAFYYAAGTPPTDLYLTTGVFTNTDKSGTSQAAPLNPQTITIDHPSIGGAYDSVSLSFPVQRVIVLYPMAGTDLAEGVYISTGLARPIYRVDYRVRIYNPVPLSPAIYYNPAAFTFSPAMTPAAGGVARDWPAPEFFGNNLTTCKAYQDYLSTLKPDFFNFAFQEYQAIMDLLESKAFVDYFRANSPAGWGLEQCVRVAKLPMTFTVVSPPTRLGSASADPAWIIPSHTNISGTFGATATYTGETFTEIDIPALGAWPSVGAGTVGQPATPAVRVRLYRWGTYSGAITPTTPTGNPLYGPPLPSLFGSLAPAAAPPPVMPSSNLAQAQYGVAKSGLYNDSTIYNQTLPPIPPAHAVDSNGRASPVVVVTGTGVTGAGATLVNHTPGAAPSVASANAAVGSLTLLTRAQRYYLVNQVPPGGIGAPVIPANPTPLLLADYPYLIPTADEIYPAQAAPGVVQQWAAPIWPRIISDVGGMSYVAPTQPANVALRGGRASVEPGLIDTVCWEFAVGCNYRLHLSGIGLP